MTAKVLVGIFVGGRARRMGGVAKGLLAAPDTGEPIVTRLVRLFADAGASDVVLVGDAAPYAALGLPAIGDEPEGIGPIGGLAALLAEAERRDSAAVAVACDLPFVAPALVERLLQFYPTAQAVAPRPGGIWEPLFARYAARPARRETSRLVAAGNRALHRVLDALGAVELPLAESEVRAMLDWDTPEDAARRG